MIARGLAAVVAVVLAARGLAVPDEPAGSAVLDVLVDETLDAGSEGTPSLEAEAHLDDAANDPSSDAGAIVPDEGDQVAGDVAAAASPERREGLASTGADDADARALVVDAIAMILAVPAPSGVGALHTPLLGARAGFVWPGRAHGPLALAFGVDGALLAGGFAAGTSAVRADRAAVVGVGRGTVGARFGGSFFALTPFASLAANGQLAGTLLRVDSTFAVRPLASVGVHVGFGLTLSLGALALGIESGIGVQGLAPSTTGALTAGWRF